MSYQKGVSPMHRFCSIPFRALTLIFLSSLLLFTTPAYAARQEIRTLLSNASATGSFVQWDGGHATLRCDGTWSTASLQLQESPDGSTGKAQDVSDVTLNSTVQGMSDIPLSASFYRVVVTGGPPSGMTCTLKLDQY